ncbi:MAG: SusC/RagA family TonB-linked outer membrane protein [Bacteroides fragilis]
MNNHGIFSPDRTKVRTLLSIKSIFLFLLFTFAFEMAYASSVYSQTKVFTMQSAEKTVLQVFKEIEKNSEFIIFYRDGVIDLNRKVSVNVVNQSVDKILEQLLAHTDNGFTIKDRQIIIYKKETSATPSVSQQKNKIKVTGVVTDAKGESIIGANVVVKGNPTIGAITNMEGRYEVMLPSDDVILLVSYLGYNTEEIKVKGRRNINVVLHEDSKALDEVVIVGYGKQKKESVVVSMSSIKPKDIVVPSRSLNNSLAGQVAGLIAVQRSGEPGYDNAEFWIRGVSTFAGGTSPLVLVDGVPRNMSDIEPDEIETFSVLKDAAATAIYGAEGANGVVLVTTKRGRVEKAKISFKTEHTISSPTRLPEFVGSADYLSLYNEALRNDGEGPQFSDELIAHYRNNDDPDLYPNTNWIDELLRKNTFSHRYTLNVRGGTEKAKYFVSGAYYNESGLFKNRPNGIYDTNIGIDRFNLRSNIDMAVSSTTTVGVDLAMQYLINNYPGTGTSTIFRSMLITPPYAFPAVYSDGTVATYAQERDANMRNPYNLLMNSGYAKEYRTGIQSKVNVNQKLDFITKGLSANLNVSYDYDSEMIIRREYNPTRYHATGRDELGQLIFSTVVSGNPDIQDPKNSATSATKKIYIDASINYKRTFGKHDVGAMLLYMQKETQQHNVPLPFRKQGFVGRATYGYDGRYFIEGNFGYTGSEAFAEGNRFGFFPAMGLAWYVSNEPFYPEVLKKVVNKLKFRFSIGRTGNDDTGGDRFLYRGTMKQDNGGYDLGFSDTGGMGGIGNGITEARFEAPYLSWEIEEKKNYGIDLGLFDNRIDLQVDYFNNKRKSILLQRNTVSNVTGFQQMPWQNFGIVKNHGVDASLTLNQKIGQVNLSARGNFTFARNEIIEYDQVPQVYPWLEKRGTRLNSNKLYIAEGLYTYDDFIINGEGLNRTYELKPGVVSGLSSGVRPGDIKYKDLNGDGKIDSNDQKEDVGNPTVPEVVYGFGFNAEWKGFYAGIFFQGAGNTSTVLGTGADATFFPFQWGVEESAVRSVVADRWTEQNPSQNVMFPRMHSNNFQNNTVASTWWLRDASFLRLKNIELGYNFDKKLLKKLNIEALRFYVQGNNLCVWDHIKMWDPEQGNSNGGFPYPLNRTFTFGLDFTF